MKQTKGRYVVVSPETHQALKVDSAKKKLSIRDYIAGLATGTLRPPKERIGNVSD